MKIILCIAFIISFSSFSYACTCAIGATEELRIEQLKNLGTIFYGEVISVGKEEYASKEQGIRYENNGEISYRTEKIRQIKFKVLRIWNGTPVEEITVGANANDSCSLNVEVGEKLLLNIGEVKVLTSLNYVNHCNTGVISSDLIKPLLKKIYGEGEVVKPQQLQQKNISELILSTVQKFIFLPA